MASVYIETSIPSFYFETRQSVRARAWREDTRKWWTSHAGAYELVTSRFVLDELSLAPPLKADAALAMLRDVRLLSEHPDSRELVKHYISHRLMPAESAGDAAHLAAASLHGIDFLLTWNCKHLANANKTRHIRVINERLGLHVPILATPLTLIPES